MIRILKYMMKVFYPYNKYASNRIEGGSYAVAIFAASFYLFMTFGLLAVFAFFIFPDFYKWYLNLKVNSTLLGVFYVIVSFSFLHLLIKEKEIKENDFTKEQVEKTINYFIAYSLIVAVMIGLVVMKFLRT